MMRIVRVGMVMEEVREGKRSRILKKSNRPYMGIHGLSSLAAISIRNPIFQDWVIKPPPFPLFCRQQKLIVTSTVYAVNDATKMRDYLQSIGFSVSLLLNQDATKETIEFCLGDSLKWKVASYDRVLVFFAGIYIPLSLKIAKLKNGNHNRTCKESKPWPRC